jgi:hypothetical protein
MEKINAGQAHENGDAEQSHRRFKDDVDQALLLRGSRDFTSRDDYSGFMGGLIEQRNAGRRDRLAEESQVLRALPAGRQESCRRLAVHVDSGSLIRVKRNVYSVNSRLIGEWVEVRIYAEHLEVCYGQKQVDRLPRLLGRQKQHINYRHIIDWLVRKPGAFASYRYRDDLFPTSRFRMAYDALQESMANRASQPYVQILHLAARESETAVDQALRVVLAEERPVTFEAVEEVVRRGQAIAPATEVHVEMTDLASFDELLIEQLFTDMEVCDGGQRRESDADGILAGVALAGVPGAVGAVGWTGAAGNAVV